jgi:hypothetical protein
VVGPDDSIPADDAAGTALAWLGDAGRPLRTLAVIWATVELERARAELVRAGAVRAAEAPAAVEGAAEARASVEGAATGSASAELAVTAVEDPHLGARVLVLPAAEDGAPVALAEPSTEGRLAATLARHGEGPAGRYVLAPAGLDAVRTLAAAAGISISRPAIGPFGSSVLVLAGRVAGPHLILVDPPGFLVDPAAVPSRS